jgi:hypothetical protein
MTLLLAATSLAMTVCGSPATDLGSPLPIASGQDPASKLVVVFTDNHWTTDKLLIARGTLTNNNPVPVTIAKIIATGFDKQQKRVAGGGAPDEASYTIGNAEIEPGATAVFKVALSDPKKAIRFVKATPLIAPDPTPIPIATPISTFAAAATPNPTAPPRLTIEELASEAWQHAQILPGSDGKYNWLEIGMNVGSLQDFLHTQGVLRPADDAAFSHAFSAIAHRIEDRLQERAFQNSQ